MVPASIDGPSPTFVVNTLTATGKTEGRSESLRRGTDHALACRSLHVANTAQVLEVEEVQRRIGLRVAGGADHRLGRQMHQIGDTLQVGGKRATLQDATRERQSLGTKAVEWERQATQDHRNLCCGDEALRPPFHSECGSQSRTVSDVHSCGQ